MAACVETFDSLVRGEDKDELRAILFPHWMVVLGYVLALILLLSIGTMEWIPLVFPLWVLLDQLTYPD